MSVRKRRGVLGSAIQDGCRTCRTRRIKCDAQRPSCNNCLRRGHSCVGYSSWEIALDVANVNAIPSPPQVDSLRERFHLDHPTPLLSVPHPVTCSGLAINDSARHAFDYFRFRAYSGFIEHGYPTLWADCAISAGLNEPAVFYAVAAAGVAERALTNIVHSTLTRPTDDAEGSLAFEMYSKALTLLREPMQRAIREEGPLGPVILSCILFLVFETRAGTHLNAMRHARTGNNILSERLGKSRSPDNMPLTPTSLSPQESGTGRVVAGSDSENGSANCSSCLHTANIETPFASLTDARVWLEVLTEAGQDLRTELHQLAQKSMGTFPVVFSRARQFCLIHTISRTIPVPTALQTRLEAVLNGFLCWGRNFRCMWTATQDISRDLLFMQIRYFHASFTLAMCRGLNEKLTDCFSDEIARTMDNVERLISHRSLERQLYIEKATPGPVADEFIHKLTAVEHKTPDAAMMTPIGPPAPPKQSEQQVAGIFDFGILPALFLIACKCRASSFRRRAARILRETERVEAINSSRTLSAYADAVLQLEEQRVAQMTDSPSSCGEFYADEVPKQARFLDVVASDSRAPDEGFTLTCTQLGREGGTDLELIEYTCDSQTNQCSVIYSEIVMADGLG